MKSNVLLKSIALTSSLLLVIAFVSYRAGAFGWLIDSDNLPAESEGRRAGGNARSNDELFYGSKSAPVFIESEEPLPSSTQPSQESAEATPVVMGGSKSYLPSGIHRRANESAQAATNMPGSHSEQQQ
jgi:hypothetical protein